MPLKTNHVRAWVSPQATQMPQLWFIAEAPGATEDASALREDGGQAPGIPLIGSAGQLHRRAMQQAKVPLNECLLWNCFDKRPPGNKVSYYYEDSKCTQLIPEGAAMMQERAKMILHHKPNLLVALGATAFYHLTGLGKRKGEGITKWRGSLVPCVFDPTIKVYAMNHPSFVQRLINEKGESKKEKGAQNAYPTYVADLERAYEQAKTPDWPRTHRRFIIPTSCEEILGHLERYRGMSGAFSVDIETIPIAGHPPIVTRIGIGPRHDEALSIPFTKGGVTCWTLQEWATILQSISALFLSERKQFVFQGGLYDLTIMAYLFGLRVRDGSVEDTMVAQQCAFPYLPKSLAYQTSVYTWEPYYKEERKTYSAGGGADASLSAYNAKDCCVTSEIWPIVKSKVDNGGFTRGYNRTMSLYPALLYMMNRGIRIDKRVQEEITEEFTDELRRTEQSIYDLTGDSFNINSPKQLGAMLFENLGFPLQGRTASGDYRTDKRVRALLRRQTKHPIFPLLDQAKKLSKYISSYCNVELCSDGRIRAKHDPTATVTWRLGTSKSDVGGGTNLTTFPKRDPAAKRLRKMFVPDEGRVLISPDLAQAEDRFVAYRAGDLEAIANYKKGKDAHWLNACKIMSWPLDKEYDGSDPEHWKMRNLVGKVTKHANNYLMGPYQFHTELLLAGVEDYTFAEAKVLQARQREATPFVTAWQEWVHNKILQDRTLITPLSRKRIFMGRLDGYETTKKACAFEPQSTVGELMLIYIRRLHRELTGTRGFEPLMTSHDDVVAQCYENEAPRVVREMASLMRYPIAVQDIYGVVRILDIPVDFKVGYSWYDLKDWDVEKGGYK